MHDCAQEPGVERVARVRRDDQENCTNSRCDGHERAKREDKVYARIEPHALAATLCHPSEPVWDDTHQNGIDCQGAREEEESRKSDSAEVIPYLLLAAYFTYFGHNGNLLYRVTSPVLRVISCELVSGGSGALWTLSPASARS